MKRFLLLISAALVGFLVAVVYIIFEGAVQQSIQLVWVDTFDVENNRMMVIPLTIILGLLFFTALHFIGGGKTKKDQRIVVKLLTVLGVGYLSLFAGATLGPEAILIPASLITGTLVAKNLANKKNSGLLGLAGFVGLFVAFFNSFIGGLLGYYLAQKQHPQIVSRIGYVAIFISGIVTYLTLAMFSHKGSFDFPQAENTTTILTLILSIIFFAAGILYQKILAITVSAFEKFKKLWVPKDWFQQALIASVGLCLLFLLGGYLVQFTGNEAIAPVFEQAKDIGLVGLIWISLVKILAIGWSVVMGYRGGLVFPLVFVASTLVAAATLYTDNFNITLCIFVFIAGAIYADRDSKVITSHTTEE